MDFTMSYILCEVMTKKISELNYLENYVGSWYFSDSALQSPIARSSHCLLPHFHSLGILRKVPFWPCKLLGTQFQSVPTIKMDTEKYSVRSETMNSN